MLNPQIQDFQSTVQGAFPRDVIYVQKYGNAFGNLTTGILLPADFPTSPSNGDTYLVKTGTTVTDNDPTKTNTGQTFVGPIVISWDSANTGWVRRTGRNQLTDPVCDFYCAIYLAGEDGLVAVEVLDNNTYQIRADITLPASLTLNAPLATISFGLGYSIYVSDNSSISCSELLFDGTTSGKIISTAKSNVEINAGKINCTTSSTDYVITTTGINSSYIQIGEVYRLNAGNMISMTGEGEMNLRAFKITGAKSKFLSQHTGVGTDPCNLKIYSSDMSDSELEADGATALLAAYFTEGEPSGTETSGGTVYIRGMRDIVCRSTSLTDYDPVEYIDQKDEVFSNYITLDSGFPSDSQTMTIGATGLITAISMYIGIGSVGNQRIYVYNPSSEIIGSTIIAITSGMSGWIKATFSDPILVKKGIQYSVVYSPNSYTDHIQMGYDSTGSYSGGSMGSNPSWDYMFRLYLEDAGYLEFSSGTAIGMSVPGDMVPFPPDPTKNILATVYDTSNYAYQLVSEDYDFYALQTPYFSSETWYQLGYFYASASSNWRATFEVIAQSVTTGDISRVSIDVSWLGAGAVKTEYRILEGSLLGARPYFRVYRYAASDIVYIYAKVKANCNITFLNHLKDLYNGNNITNSLWYFLYCGNGTDPTGVGTYTLLYDTTVDDAGYYEPKTTSMTADFYGTTRTGTLEFSINGNMCTLNFHQNHENAINTNADYIHCAAGTVPDKWLPSQSHLARIHGCDAGAMRCNCFDSLYGWISRCG